MVLHGQATLVLHIQPEVKSTDDNGKQGTVVEYDAKLGKYSAMALSCCVCHVAALRRSRVSRHVCILDLGAAYPQHPRCFPNFPPPEHGSSPPAAQLHSCFDQAGQCDLLQPSFLVEKAAGQFVSFCPNLPDVGLACRVSCIALFHAQVLVNWRDKSYKVKEELHGLSWQVVTWFAEPLIWCYSDCGDRAQPRNLEKVSEDAVPKAPVVPERQGCKRAIATWLEDVERLLQVTVQCQR